jgi:peptidoglycan/LPS O-acetylase OafA/YrhL
VETDQRPNAPPVSGGQTREGVSEHRRRIPILDGWRAVSILLVLAAQLLPLGPHFLQLNWVAGAAGMALFFTLSGFLIVQFLAGGMPLGLFVMKRLARIIPLAWSAMAVLMIWHHYPPGIAARNLLFIANLPPVSFLIGGHHLWSLCVEMQFYMGVAAIVFVFGPRGLYLVPVLALAVTSARIFDAQPISVITWHRVDEILAGGTIALIYSGWLGSTSLAALRRLPMLPLLLLFLAASHPATGPLQYLRPYFAAALVGTSLSHAPARVQRVLSSVPMAYIAEISYSLYVVHGVLVATWLGSGSQTVKYLKRPLLLAATFAIAHLSTRYFEQPINRAVRDLGKRSAAAPTPSGA